MVCVTGFQLYKDANEFYFSFECVSRRQRRASPAVRAARFLHSAPRFALCAER